MNSWHSINPARARTFGDQTSGISYSFSRSPINPARNGSASQMKKPVTMAQVSMPPRIFTFEVSKL